MFLDAGTKIEIFFEKCLLWMFEGGKSPFRPDEPPRERVRSQSGAVTFKNRLEK